MKPLTYTFVLVFLVFNNCLKAQTITQEIGKVSFIKSQYYNDKNNSDISLAYYKTYLFPDSLKATYKVIISTTEIKKTEVGNSIGGAAYTGGWGPFI